jgi:hypothetical protein
MFKKNTPLAPAHTPYLPYRSQSIVYFGRLTAFHQIDDFVPSLPLYLIRPAHDLQQ